MSQERIKKHPIHLGTTYFNKEGKVVNIPVNTKPAEKKSILAPIISLFSKNPPSEKQIEPAKIIPFPTAMPSFEMEDQNPFTDQALVIPENNIRQFPVRVAIAKGVKTPDKIQAKRALEALVDMNRNSRPDEQIEYNIIPFKLREGHNYIVNEFDADKVPMEHQNIDTTGNVKENNDGSVVAYQMVKKSNLIMLPSSEENLALITNRPNSVIKATENVDSAKEISMAVVIEELGAGLLPEGTEYEQVGGYGSEAKIDKPMHDFFTKDEQQPDPAPADNITYMKDYKKAVGFPEEVQEDQAA